MSILQNVQTSTAHMGTRIVIAGAEKQGKTTFATGAPGALLIPLEQGYAGVKTNYVPMLTDYTQLLQLQNEITQAAQRGQFQFRTLVFDSATALERLIHTYVITLDPKSKTDKSLSMETAHGGYGKAYGVANKLFGDFLAWCDMLVINARMTIVLTAHVFSAKVLDPQNGEYNTWDVQLHSPKDQKTYGKREMLTQWADVIGYLHDPITVSKDANSNMARAISLGQGRVLGVERTPSYVAGNRYGMRGTIALPAPPACAWNQLAGNLHQAAGIDVWNREAA